MDFVLFFAKERLPLEVYSLTISKNFAEYFTAKFRSKVRWITSPDQFFRFLKYASSCLASLVVLILYALYISNNITSRKNGKGWESIKKSKKTDENSKIWKSLHASGTDRPNLVISKIDSNLKIFDIFGDSYPF